MRALVWVMLVGLSAGGCKGGNAIGDKFDEILIQLEKFRAEMCACKDVACAEKVMEDRREYRKTMRQKLEKGTKPTAAQDKRGKQLEDELTACRKALDPTAGSGSAESGSAGSADAGSADGGSAE